MNGRKKSIASSGPNGGLPQIDTGVVNNLLRKPGSSAVPLYQQCSALGSRLARVHDFAPFFTISSRAEASSRQSVDPVHALWDCLALGTPLCFLFNLLDIPSEYRLDVNCDPDDIDPDDLKARKRATAKFIMGINRLQEPREDFGPKFWEGNDTFTVGDLVQTDRNTNGFVKVVGVVTQLLDRLPEHVYMASPPMPLSPSTATGDDATRRKSGSFDSLEAHGPESAREAARRQIIAELLDTERKFVQDLEVMQNFATELSTQNLMSQDTIHRLFLNVNALLDFQRHFLIAMEGIFEQKWPDQRWGSIFINHEEAFEVYEPYCANFNSASELLQAEEQNLMPLAHMIHPKSELPAFLIKPVQRICKYPLLLESLAKKTSPEEYPHHAELLEGLASTKRITDRVNEAERRAENLATCKALETRVQDWKGHHIANFGQLRLDDLFSVNKSDVDRDYHVFLFEKIILCCKEAPIAPQINSRKVGKSNSLLKKTATALQPPPLFGASAKKKTTPLLLKGRIFLSNVTRAISGYKEGVHGLEVWWRGDNDLEFFTLRCRTEEQMKMWESNINGLIKLSAARYLAAERPRSPSGSVVSRAPPKSMSQGSLAGAHDPSQHPFNAGPVRWAVPPHPQSKDLQAYFGTSQIPLPPPGSARLTYDDEGFAEDEFDESPTEDRHSRMSTYSTTGSNSINIRRPGSTPIPRPDLQQDPRRTTGDYPGNGYRANGGQQPPVPRAPSVASQQNRPLLRSQFSSVRLDSAYRDGTHEVEDEDTQRQHPQIPERYTPSPFQAQHLRLRSSSTPATYSQHPQTTRTVPRYNAWSATGSQSSRPSVGREKRDSGSSSSSGDRSSGYSTNDPGTWSPVTPYGSSETTLSSAMSGVTLKSGAPDSLGLDRSVQQSSMIKVKVHYRTDLFVIVVSRMIEYNELVDKVGRKIRLCGGDRDDSPLKVKYCDEEEDLITLASDEDVQMAFDTKASVISLYVT